MSTTLAKPILFPKEILEQFLKGNKSQFRMTERLGEFNASPDEFRYDGEDEDDNGIHYFEKLRAGEPTENYYIVRAPYKVGDIVPVERSDKQIKITAVRAKRLQEISYEDCRNEGIDFSKIGFEFKELRALNYFIDLWNNTLDLDYEFALNPFVWVYNFENYEA